MTDGAAAPIQEVLYLFTSNMRPLYEQDALDVLAAPSNTHYRFRYQADARRDYLGTGLRERWVANTLVGTKALVCFSIQQEAGYHPSAFLPVRFGVVVATRAEGSLHIVDFKIGDHATLAFDPERLGESVTTFSTNLKDLLSETPDVKKSAVLGPLVPGLQTGNEKSPLPWEHAVEYLSRTLSFRNHIFIRFSGLSEAGSVEEVEIEQGVARLTAGRTYELRIAHLQPKEANVLGKYQISVDGQILSVVGDDEFAISSRYDTIPVLLHATDRDDTRETAVIVKPSAGTLGANLQIHVRVSPNRARQVGGALGTAVSLLLIALPGILGTSAPIEARITLGSVGFLLGGGLLAFRLKRA